MVDQIFETDEFPNDTLYMPEFDVCAEISSVTTGFTVGLATCNGSAEQSFKFSGEGTIAPASAPDM